MKTLNYFNSTFNFIVSSLIGSILGMINSIVVNFTLLEISISQSFSLYAGLVILFAGIIMALQVFSQKDWSRKDRLIFQTNCESFIKAKKNYLYCYTLIMFMSGLTILTLDKSFYIYMSYFYKMPYYIAKIGVSFNLTFSIMLIKIINYVPILLQNNDNDIKIINTYHQHFVILSVSVIIGVAFALMFSFIKFENASNNFKYKLQFLSEQNYSIPIGICFGCLTGYINEYITELNNYDYHQIENISDEDA